jgi:hypothetical protein
MIDSTNYTDVTENGQWLEDRLECSRFATEGEETVWVCHCCETIVDDPDEHDCWNSDEE